jgi:Fur family ferric uptake transcriptional regulator
MSNAHDLFLDVLKQHGYSHTKARVAVFDTFSKPGQEPLTMHELVEQTHSVDRASIYRTVALFEALGIVQRIHIGWKYKLELSDIFANHHHHLTCLDCKRMIELSEGDLEVIIKRLSHDMHFTPVSHQLEIQGYCQACQKQRRIAGAGTN